MGIIEDPDLHVKLFRLVYNCVHILPPLRAAEIRMRTAFNTECADVGIMNHIHIFSQCFLVLAVLPEKGQNVVFFPAGK